MKNYTTLVLWATAIMLTAWLLPLHAQAGPEQWADDACRQWVDRTMARMNTEARLAQVVVATVPAQADGRTKKWVRTLAKKSRIGGFVFDGGTPEEQAILTNLAQKNAAVPVVVMPGGKRLSQRLDGVPVLPQDEALACMADTSLLALCRAEMHRQYAELGMVDDRLQTPAGTLNLPGGVFVLTDDPVGVLMAMTDSVTTGSLTAARVDERCRLALTCKYMLGLHTRPAPLQISGLNYRVNSEEGQAASLRLRQAAVTVVNNYFGFLPLAPAADGKGMALLSIGPKDKDQPFVEAMTRHAAMTHLYLPRHADAAQMQDVRSQLSACSRVVVSITPDEFTFLSQPTIDFLAELDLAAPVGYAIFAPALVAMPMEAALAKSSAVVLAHADDADLQRHVADVFFAQAQADGRLAVNIGAAFPAGTGCDIRPGMSPGKLIPEDYGMKSYVLQRIDHVVADGLAQAAYPGCRVLVMKDGKAVYDKGFGTHSNTDTTQVRPTDMFDLSSLTGTMATTLAVMKLYDEGKLKLDAKASAYVPALRTTNKRNITVRDLLLHEGGLPPHLRFYVEAIDPRTVHGPYAQSWEDQWHHTRVSEHSFYSSDFKFKRGLMSDKKTSVHTLQVADGMWLNQSFKRTILQQIAKSDFSGRRYIYSEPGLIVLQQVVEAVSGLPLNLYVAKEFYAPMGLQRTMFRPLDRYGKDQVMPTASNDFLRRQDLCGYVHNEAAAFMGGVAGNAGLFSTAEETGKVFQMLLNGGTFNGKRFLSEATCRLFLTETSLISRRGLGFDRPDASIALRSPCSKSTPVATFGQTGFTGTCAWADPVNHIVYVFLSNRMCPDVWNTKLGDLHIRKRIQELIYQSLKTDAAAPLQAASRQSLLQ